MISHDVLFLKTCECQAIAQFATFFKSNHSVPFFPVISDLLDTRTASNPITLTALLKKLPPSRAASTTAICPALALILDQCPGLAYTTGNSQTGLDDVATFAAASNITKNPAQNPPQLNAAEIIFYALNSPHAIIRNIMHRYLASWGVNVPDLLVFSSSKGGRLNSTLSGALYLDVVDLLNTRAPHPHPLFPTLCPALSKIEKHVRLNNRKLEIVRGRPPTSLAADTKQFVFAIKQRDIVYFFAFNTRLLTNFTFAESIYDGSRQLKNDTRVKSIDHVYDAGEMHKLIMTFHNENDMPEQFLLKALALNAPFTITNNVLEHINVEIGPDLSQALRKESHIAGAPALFGCMKRVESVNEFWYIGGRITVSVQSRTWTAITNASKAGARFFMYLPHMWLKAIEDDNRARFWTICLFMFGILSKEDMTWPDTGTSMGELWYLFCANVAYPHSRFSSNERAQITQYDNLQQVLALTPENCDVRIIAQTGLIRTTDPIMTYESFSYNNYVLRKFIVILNYHVTCLNRGQLSFLNSFSYPTEQ
jgi:hypothetical protein